MTRRASADRNVPRAGAIAAAWAFASAILVIAALGVGAPRVTSASDDTSGERRGVLAPEPASDRAVDDTTRDPIADAPTSSDGAHRRGTHLGPRSPDTRDETLDAPLTARPQWALLRYAPKTSPPAAR